LEGIASGFKVKLNFVADFDMMRLNMKFRQSLFWDTNPKLIDTKKHAAYIIERVLEFGNDKEVCWLWNFYRPSLIKKVINNSRSLSPKTISLWRLLLNK